MRSWLWLLLPCLLLGLSEGALLAQTPLTWEQVRERFQKNNPNLLAGQLLIGESRANEMTAGLRPNPVFSSINDQFDPTDFRPANGSQWTQSITQLIERRRKRPLRVESARLATSIATTDQRDLERQLLFTLRDAFVRTLQAKAALAFATQNLAYYDKVLEVNRQRYKAGDIAQVDLARLELQRAQFESDLVNAQVNLRTAKIALLALMNERQPVDSFDVTGLFDYRPLAMTAEQARQTSLAARPDLRSAVTAIAKAHTDEKLAWANGSTDPALYAEYQRTFTNTLGFGVIIPLRIFDRNQGEKERARLEIARAERTRQAVEAGVLRDVDSAYATVESVRDLIVPYRDRYIPESHDVRETVSFAYSRGGASLLDFLDAQKAYRDTQLAYQTLIASYLSALNQLSQAVGQEVLP
jgi:cobalt-zinc-cadmium efflux system outer membrane protein